jgi:hypothetical protein
MFISLCLSSFHSESSDHSLGPVEAELRSAGRVGAPAPTCASMAHACGSIHMELAFFLALFSPRPEFKASKKRSFAPPGGWGHPPLRVRLWPTLAAQFHRGGIFVDLFRHALNLMALEVRCA